MKNFFKSKGFIVTSLGETGLFLLSEFKTKNAQYYSLMIVYQ